MRDFIRLLVVGIIFCFAAGVQAEDFGLLVIPDNIVTENAAIDSFIYNASAEFFADEIVTILDDTDYISTPHVSEVRAVLKKDSSGMLAAKNLTSRFQTSYNIDYPSLKKIANKFDKRYVLLITSFIDSENYILRRTPWDFLNIPGASVIDPAYKVSTYAVLVDTKNNNKLWADTYYKTISVCENRIITRGASPQTEQLAKIKDYSRYVCPQIAQNVQQHILPEDVYAKESKQVYFDMGNIDNVFTKKYRHLGKEYDKVYVQRKADFEEFKEDTKVKIEETKKQIKQANEDRKLRAQEKKQQAKLEVKAQPVYKQEESGLNGISNKIKSGSDAVKNAVFTRKTEPSVEPVLEGIEIKKSKKNNLYGEYNSDKPALRDYN